MAYDDLLGALGANMAPDVVDDGGPLDRATITERLIRKGIADIERPRAPAPQAPTQRVAPKAPEPATSFGSNDEIVDAPKASFGAEDQIVDAISDGVPLPRPRPEKAGDGFSAFEAPTPPLSPQVDPSMLSPQSLVSKKQPLVGGVEIAPENLAPKKTPTTLTEAWDSVGIGKQAKEQLGSGVETLKQGWYGTNLQTNMRALSVFDKIDAGDAVDPQDDAVGYSQLSPEQRAKVRRDLEQKVGENIAGIVKSKREQEGVALDPKKAQTFDKAPIGYGRNPRADEIVKAGNEGRWGDVWKTFKEDPLGITQQFAVESLPVSAPMLAGGVGLSVFGAVPTVLGTFGLSYGSEFGPRVVENVSEELAKLKIDLHNEEAVAAAIKANPNIVKQAADKAARGAAGPALFDAISFGSMKGLKPGGSFMGNTGRVARNTGLEIATEPLGEAAGQVLEEGAVTKPGDLIAETLGSGPQVVAGTGMATIREAREAKREGFQPPEPGAPDSVSKPPENPPASTVPPGVQTQGGSGGGSPAETASQATNTTNSATDAAAQSAQSEPAPGATPTPAEAAVAPPESSPQAPAATPIQTPELDRDRAILRAFGYNDEQITDMSAAQRVAEVQDAIDSGVDPDQAQAEFAKQDAALGGLAAMFGEGDKAVGTKEAPVNVETSADVDTAAAAAATEYSPEQGEVNNRKLGHLKWNGLQGSIEVASGGTRRGTNPKTGEPWETTHSVPYGYWKNTIGADKMHVDAYFGPEMEAGHPVYVLDENDPATGKFRQIKTFAGFPSAEAARAAYLGTSSKTPDMIGGITPIDAGEFPTWVKDKRNTTKPAAQKAQKVEQRQPKGNFSLMQYLAWRGGIRPDGDIRSMQLPRNIAVPGVGYRSLIRSGGMPIDKMVEAARDGGYLPPAPTDRPDDVAVGRQLLDMLDEESRGRKTFPEGTETTTKRDEERAAEQSESDRDKLMAEFAAAGVPVESVDPLDLIEAERIMQEEGLEPDDAFEAAVMRRARIEDVATEPEFGNIYGEDWWDAVQSDAALQDGAASQEEGVDSERPVAEGRDDAQGGELPGAREDRGEESQEAAGNDDAGKPAETGSTAEVAEDREQVESAEKPFFKYESDRQGGEPEGATRAELAAFYESEAAKFANPDGTPKAVNGAINAYLIGTNKEYARQARDGETIDKDKAIRAGDKAQRQYEKERKKAEAEQAVQQAASKAMEAALDKIEEAVEAGDRKAVMVAGKEARKLLADTPQSIKDADPEYWGQFGKVIAKMMKPDYVTGQQQAAAESADAGVTTEQTEAGEQTVLPGAEKATDADLAQKKADEPLKPDVAQKPADEGLFGDERNQGDLLDEIKKKPAEEKGEAEVSTGEIETVTQAEPEVDQKKAKLEDAGEKIGGARKDQWSGGLTSSDLDDMTGAERDKNVTKQNVWPRPDYAELVADGMSPMTAALIKVIYDRIPAKYQVPQYSGWDEETAQRNYVTVLHTIRDVLKDVKSADEFKGWELSNKVDAILKEIDGQSAYNLTRAISKGRRSRDLFSMVWRPAEKLIEKGFPNIEPWQRIFAVAPYTPFNYDTKKVEKQVFLVRKRTSYKELARFDTEEEAQAHAKKLYEETGGRDQGEGEEPKRPHLDDVDRAGPDYRKDRDVTGDDFITDFGFRGVEFGNWVAGDERQKVINLAYDAMHDLARVLNLSPKALSLDGKLAIAFGARGRGGKAAAHYEPDRVVINMTKLVGAGSLAHEWAHAVDHYLGELATGKDYKQSVQSVSGWYEPRRYEGQIGTLSPRLSRATNDLMSALLYQSESAEAKKARIAEEMKALKRGLQSWVDHAERLKEKGRKGENITRSLNAAKRNIESWERHLAHKERAFETRAVKIDTEYYAQAKKLSGKQAEKGYWARPTEMFARAFEAWVFDQVQGEGNTSQYLVQGVEGDRYGSDFKGNPYPAGAERERINKAFERWAKSLATGEGKHGAGTKLQGSTEEEPVEQTTHTVEVPEITPEEKVDILESEMEAVEASTEEANDRDLSAVFAQHLRDGKAFEGILSARKMAKEAGHDLDPKQIEEALELAVVKVARGIVASGDSGFTPKEIYNALVNLYGLQPRLGTRTSTSMREQAFSTPVPLAYLASRLAQIGPDDKVMEPTAGNGALLIEVSPQNALVNEINPQRAKNLESQGFSPSSVDAAQKGFATGIINVEGGVDVVIANPPFGAVKEGSASTVFDLTDIQNGYQTKEIDHAIALRSLAAMHGKGGRAVLIVGGINKMAGTSEARSDGYNSKAKREFYKVLYDRYNVTDHFTVAGELYERQGAGWPVDVIVIEGRGKSQRSLPAVDVPRVFSTWDDLGGLLNGNVAGAGRIRELSGTTALGDDAGGAGRSNVSGGEDAGGQRDRDGRNAAEQPEGVQSVSVSEQSERGAAGVEEGAAGGQTELRESGGNDPVPPPERSPSGLDDFDAAFDAALDETFGAQEAPKSSSDTDFERGRANAAKDGPDSTRRRGGSDRERAGYDAAKRSTSDVAKSAVSNAVDSADAAMAGLVQLFGGGKTVGEGLNFDEQTYAKAKPLFIQAAQRFSEFKNDVTELVKRMVGELQRSYGLTRDALVRMRPYLKQFIADVQSGAVTLGETVAKAAAPAKQEKETVQQVSYAPKSGQQGLGTLVPVNMRRSITESLESLAARVGDLDAFVAKELGYGANSIGEYFAAEQIDALALAIDNIQRGKGFIIGDQTGIGKGRVNAGIIRWAIKNGHVPIFVTEKPNLYGDMYRDLRDIGIQDELDRDVRIVMTNNNEKVPLDEEGKVTLKTDDKQAGILAAIADPETLRSKYDVVFTTYNQMQSVKGKETGQRTFLRAMAPHAILIFDESHNAGGQQGERKKAGAVEGRAALARKLIQQAKGVFYSSATYAKRPDVMDLYSKTDMVLAVEKVEDLAENIARGGVPMQQAVAAMLAEGGQYIRRERSFEGVTYDTPVVAAPREQYDGMASALAAINHLSGFVQGAADKVGNKLKAEAKIVLGDNATGSAGAESINFTAIMHNVINQMLLALKAKPAVEIALEAIKRGEKPVFTVSGTMESFLTDFVDNLGIKPGEAVEGDFRDVLMKYLNRTRTITIRSPFAQNTDKDGKKKHYLTDEELGRPGVRAYDEAEEIIRNLDLSGLPLSPLDYIKGEMQKAGYKIGEITGRTLTVDYTGEKPTLSSRGAKDKSIAGRRASIRDFNSGALDAMIINQAGATGLSLHASASFKDQKRRHMIIVAPEANIDTHMQMLGRIHRTGQVITPTYSQLIADVPAEKRPAAVLAKKMASLNANTTASRGGALTAKDVPDFINEYGDMVAVAYIADHPDLNPKLTFPIHLRENGSYDPDDAMRKLTGRIPLLPLAQQEEVYASLEGEFNALMEQMKAAGENALEAQSFDLKARTLETTQVVPAKDGSNSPFAAPVNIERVSVARLGKPFTPAEVMNKVGQELGATGVIEGDLGTLANMLDMLNDLFRQGWGQHASDKEAAERTAAVKEFEAYKRGIVDEIGEADKAEKERAKLDAVKDRWSMVHAVLTIGRRVTLKTASGNLTGIVLKVEQKGEPKNPLALSTWKATFAIADASRQITIPFSRLWEDGKASEDDALAIEVAPIAQWIETPKQTLERFEKMQSDAREERFIATGNILAAYDWLDRKGSIINYTAEDGTTRQGIITSRQFDLGKHAVMKGKPLRDPQEVQAWLDSNIGATIWSKGNVVRIRRVPSRYGQTTYSITAEKKKKQTGGRFYLDKGLTNIAGDFYSAGGGMNADVNETYILPAIRRMQELGAVFTVQGEPPKPTKAGEPQLSIGAVALTPAAAQARSDIESHLSDIVRRVTGNTIRVQFPDEINVDSAPDWGKSEPVGAFGQYVPADKLIRLAMNPSMLPTADQTAYHEAFHAIEDTLLNDQERALLRREEARLRANLNRHFTNSAVSGGRWADQIAGNEVRAISFEIYSHRRDRGLRPDTVHIGIRVAFERIYQMLRRVRNLLQGYGFRTAEDIFSAAYEGKIGQRGAAAPRTLSDVFREMEPQYSVAPAELAPERRGVAPPPESIEAKLRARNLPKLAAISRSLGIGGLRPAEFRTQVQDKFIRVKNIQKAQERVTGPIPERMDTYTAESLYYGRTGEQIERLDREHIDPLIREIKKRGLTLEQVNDYLYARHAPERNERIREINPDIESPSGMSDAEAEAIIAAIPEDKLADYQEIERRVREIIDQTNATRLRGGLVNEEALEQWNAAYENYVPLRGFAENTEEDEASLSTGRGMDVRGPESRRALGRESAAEGPLYYVILQAQAAIVRAEKDRVGRTMLRYVQANPNPNLWTVNNPETKRVVSPLTGMVVEMVDPAWKTKDNVFAVKVGGRQHFITFHGKDGKDIARALKNIGAATLHPIISFMSSLTRLFARMQTAWNPEFWVSNFPRDIGEAFVNLQAQDQKRFGRLFLKYLIPAMGGAFKGQQGKFDGRFSQAFQEFDRAGGRIRFFGLEDPDDIKANVESKMRRLSGGAVNNMISAGEHAIEALEIVNGSIENATRLAAYMAARDVGLTQAQAAKIARELTVNFNRKGELGSVISAAYAFANAAMQGTVRMAQAMKSKRVRRFAYGLAAFGALLALYNIGAGGDDDDGTPFYEKIPPWERDKNFILMWPRWMGKKKGAYAKIPLPYGYLPFHILGARIASYVAGGTTKEKAISAVFKSLLDTFDPIGRDENKVAQFAPTITRPGIHIYSNENWTGKPINPVNAYGKDHRPDSERHFDSASKFSVSAAKQMNALTGGSAFKSGYVDMSPGTIDYMLNFLGGGVGRFVANSASVPWKLYQGEEVTADKAPLSRRFVGQVNKEAFDRGAYYEDRDKARDAPVSLARKAAKRGDPGAADAYDSLSKNATQGDLAGEALFDKVDRQISKYRAEEKKVREDAKLDETTRKQKIEEIRAEIATLRNNARKTFKEMQQGR